MESAGLSGGSFSSSSSASTTTTARLLNSRKLCPYDAVLTLNRWTCSCSTFSSSTTPRPSSSFFKTGLTPAVLALSALSSSSPLPPSFLKPPPLLTLSPPSSTPNTPRPHSPLAKLNCTKHRYLIPSTPSHPVYLNRLFSATPLTQSRAAFRSEKCLGQGGSSSVKRSISRCMAADKLGGGRGRGARFHVSGVKWRSKARISHARRAVLKDT
ncbi:hypothetical protein HBI56_154820 [Parastagonospora nodorum]|nr:hypothetical protein HBH56_117490 [Parastagonospora nodorum]KAH3928887.1 hypothetical protein HBH54_131730 [Parastagonospora nodorum]KAH3998604.1 hypothetical protein HBI10_126800 [Parastagonospora nodorum]KAH4024084.1 hypothetical protein HBI13_082760 [Parastagonospora nodorum]KAH4072436.1 hypothetical protein HBH50_059560 [Parastagonospora nodorum]